MAIAVQGAIHGLSSSEHERDDTSGLVSPCDACYRRWLTAAACCSYD